jgi:hypothetical protein
MLETNPPHPPQVYFFVIHKFLELASNKISRLSICLFFYTTPKAKGVTKSTLTNPKQKVCFFIQ